VAYDAREYWKAVAAHAWIPEIAGEHDRLDLSLSEVGK
jgi:hypothetical protein